MREAEKPLVKALVSAKEHLAGVRAAQAWHRDLVAQHLLRSESPIRDEPLPKNEEGKP